LHLAGRDSVSRWGRARRGCALALLAAWALAPAAALAQQRPVPQGKPAPSPPAPGPTPKPSAPESAPQGAAGDTAKEEARAHFERGIALSDEEAWEAALVEFARSRELFATRGNTKNLALCLRKLHRFDEALDAYEALDREFSPLPPQDRAFVDKELDELKKRVGRLEVSGQPGASVSVGGRDRGTTPLAGPIRLSAGTHVVRVHKEGFLPLETRVDVLGGQTVQLDARLDPLTQSGRLRVAEQSGKAVDVELDHAVVGKTPWEGTLSPGDHTVRLRGAGNLGTQPASVPVKLNDLATITLAVEPLESELRVEPSPTGATVAIDGVVVGRGLWVGRLRAGPHTVEIGFEGFLPERRELALQAGASDRLALELERDPESPLWRRVEPPRFVIEAAAFGALGGAIGGEVTSGCSGACSRGLSLGGGGMLRAGYELGVGFGFGVEAGYVALTQQVKGRSEVLTPKGLPPNPGLADDRLTLSGLNLGATAWFKRGKPWGWEARLGAGVVLGTMRDERSGDFSTVTARLPDGSPLAYHIAPLAESGTARFLYATPEVRATYRVSRSAELGLGVQALLLVALTQPTWQDRRPLITGTCGPIAAGCVTDGQATFGVRTTASQFTVVASPVVTMRVDF
jgi:hypothetical protein